MLLSICIPTFNRASSVLRTVKKCLSIPGDFYEVLVVDDSTDDETMCALHEIDSCKFRYLKNDVNYGYANMGRALLLANGDYCLLLGDKDELVDVNWNAIVTTINNMPEVSIFHWEYTNKEGIPIRKVGDRNKGLLKAGSFEALLFAKYHFLESAGFIFRHKDIEDLWGRIDQSSLIWNLYPQSVLALELATGGDCFYINGIKTELAEEERKIHITQTYAGHKTPYWHPLSRKKQNSEWIDLIGEVVSDKETRIHLMHTVCVNAIKQVGHYYSIIYDFNRIKLPFYASCEAIMESDRNKRPSEWMVMMNHESQRLRNHIKEYGKGSLKLETEYLFRRIKMKLDVYRSIVHIYYANRNVVERESAHTL